MRAPRSLSSPGRAVPRADDRALERGVVEAFVRLIGRVAPEANGRRDVARDEALRARRGDVGRAGAVTGLAADVAEARRRDGEVVGAARLVVAGDVTADARRRALAVRGLERLQGASVLRRPPEGLGRRVTAGARRRAHVGDRHGPRVDGGPDVRRRSRGGRRRERAHAHRLAGGGQALALAVVGGDERAHARLIGHGRVEGHDAVVEPVAGRARRQRRELAPLACDGRAQRLETLFVVRPQRRLLRLARRLRQALLVVRDLAPMVGEDRAQLRARAAIGEGARAVARDDVQIEATEVPAQRHRLESKRPAGELGRLQVEAAVAQHGPVDAGHRAQQPLAVGRAAHVNERDDDARAPRPERRDRGARRLDRIACLHAPRAPPPGIGRRRRGDAEDADLHARRVDEAIGLEQQAPPRVDEVRRDRRHLGAAEHAAKQRHAQRQIALARREGRHAEPRVGRREQARAPLELARRGRPRARGRLAHGQEQIARVDGDDGVALAPDQVDLGGAPARGHRAGARGTHSARTRRRRSTCRRARRPCRVGARRRPRCQRRAARDGRGRPPRRPRPARSRGPRHAASPSAAESAAARRTCSCRTRIGSSSQSPSRPGRRATDASSGTRRRSGSDP